MKTLITIVSVAILLGCNAKKTVITNTIAEEIKLGSLGLKHIFADSTLQFVNASNINELNNNLADTSLFAGLEEGFYNLIYFASSFSSNI